MSSRKARALEKRALAVLYDNFTSLDFYGPWAIFQNAFRDPETKEQPAYTLHTLALHPTGKPPGLTVQSGDNVATVCQYTWENLPEGRWDVLLIPGGQGTKALVDDSDLIKKLRLMCGRADTVATVGTGAALIAKTGLLDGSKATSHKATWDWVVSQGEKVEWLKGARWVDTGRVITSAGVSAGIDMSLALISRRDGNEIAKHAAQAIEYHWDGCSDATGWEPGQKPTLLSTPSKTASTGSRFNTPTK